MKSDLLIVCKGRNRKVAEAMEEIEKEVLTTTGKTYAVKETKSLPEAKKKLTKGDNK